MVRKNKQSENRKTIREKARMRYENPVFKKLKKYEDYVNETFADDGYYYTDIISIKDKSQFFDMDNKRLDVVVDLLDEFCGLSTQYIGIDDEVVLAVVPKFFLSDICPPYLTNNGYRKLEDYVDRTSSGNLVLACLLLEKFIRAVESNAIIEIAHFDKEYLEGRFVVGIDTYSQSISPHVTISQTANDIPSDIEERVDSFLNILISQDWLRKGNASALKIKQKILAYCFNLNWLPPFDVGVNVGNESRPFNFRFLRSVPCNIEMSGETYGITSDLFIQQNIPDSPFTTASKVLGEAMMTNDFHLFEALLVADAELQLSDIRNIVGKDNIIKYWKEWREKYVTGIGDKAGLFEVVHSNYYFNTCLLLNQMIVLFYLDGDKISKMYFNLCSHGSRTNPDYDYLDFPRRQDSNKVVAPELVNTCFQNSVENIYSKKGIDYHFNLSLKMVDYEKNNPFDLLVGLDKLILDEGLLQGELHADMQHIVLKLHRPSDSQKKAEFTLWWEKIIQENDVLKSLQVEESEMGVWQLYLLMTAPCVMPAPWPGTKHQRTFIFRENDLNSIDVFNNSDLSKMIVQPIAWPSVTVERRSDGSFVAHVYCCFWNDWKGLVREHIKITLRNRRVEQFDNVGDFVIYNYHCGIFL